MVDEHVDALTRLRAQHRLEHEGAAQPAQVALELRDAQLLQPHLRVRGLQLLGERRVVRLQRVGRDPAGRRELAHDEVDELRDVRRCASDDGGGVGAAAARQRRVGGGAGGRRRFAQPLVLRGAARVAEAAGRVRSRLAASADQRPCGGDAGEALLVLLPVGSGGERPRGRRPALHRGRARHRGGRHVAGADAPDLGARGAGGVRRVDV